MFNINLTTTTIDLSFAGIIPGLSLVIHVEKQTAEAPIKVEVKIDTEVKKS